MALSGVNTKIRLLVCSILIFSTNCKTRTELSTLFNVSKIYSDIKALEGTIITISLVLNGKDSSIPEATKKRILDCVEKLNYYPDTIAQSLATQKTKTIGLLIPDITNNFFTEYVHSVQLKLNSYGYDVLLCISEDKMEDDIKYINLFKNRRVDGLMLAMSAESLQPTNLESTKKLLGINSKDEVIPFSMHCIDFL